MMHKEELKAYKRRLMILRIKAAYFGLGCPPHILMEIEDIEVLLNKKKIGRALKHLLCLGSVTDI